jgi:hypothetical protein
MERIAQILRALFQRALSAHERQAPALTDVAIDVAQGAAEPRLWVVFSNGYRTSVALHPQDCFTFCERHGTWDLESLRRALLREAHFIYALMLRDRLEARERDRRTSLTEQVRRISRSLLARSLRPRREVPRFPRLNRFYPEECSLEAHERGIRLLKENLTPAQRQQLEKHAYFEVIGGRTGKRYRIRHGRSMNIDQLDRNGRRVCGWCFFPLGGLVAGDVMLAQKVALELFETEALKIANRMW